MLARTAALTVNHLLEQASWARDRLVPYAGMTARFLVFPLDFSLTIEEGGRVREPDPGREADVTLSVPPSLLPRLLLGDEAAYREVGTDGDTAFAGEVAYLFRHLRWDLEEDLSKVVGDVLARRIAQGGRGVIEWQKQAAQSLSQATVEYLTEESATLAKPGEVQEFVAGVDALRDDMARLEARMARLSGKLP